MLKKNVAIRLTVVASLTVFVGCVGASGSTDGDGGSRPADAGPSPDAPSPDAPSPDAPSPDVSSPDAPSPDAPSPDAPSPDAPSPDAPSPDVVPDFAMPGPHAVEESSETVATSGCSLDVEIRAASSGGPVIILAHGFARGTEDMDAWARHLASWGFVVVNAPFCTFSGHEANGLAFAEVGAQQAIAYDQPGAFYVGFSAGGLATLVATATDENALGYFGLDSVDNGEVGTTYAAQLLARDADAATTTPVAGLLGEPSSCNSENNFAPVWTATGGDVHRMIGASHFDFETSECTGFDIGCSFCAPTSTTTNGIIVEIVTSWLSEQAGLAPQGASILRPENPRGAELRNAGTIGPLP